MLSRPALAHVLAPFVVVVVACAGADKHAESPAESPAESLVRVIEGLADRVDAAGARCGDYAELVFDWIEREGDAIPRLVGEHEERVADMTDDELARLNDRLTEAIEVIVLRAAECGDHGEAQRAFAEFDAVIEGA